MRKLLSSELGKCFDAKVQSLHPRFVRMAPSVYLRRYELEVDPGLSLYLLLQTRSNVDGFTVAVGWGPPGDDPEPNFGEPLLERPEAVRLGRLDPRNREDLWWWLDPTEPRTLQRLLDPPAPIELCRGRIPVLLDEVISLVSGFAVPYWERVVCYRSSQVGRSAIFSV